MNSGELITSPSIANQMAVASDAPPATYDSSPGPLADLRSRAMSLPIPVMEAALSQYWEQRCFFYDWLKGKLVPGIHFGYPPGCKPKYDDEGNLLVYSKGNENVIGPDEWRAKPSLYKAGADFIADLMGLRAEYAADTAAWEVLGKPSNTFIMCCKLYSRSNGELVAEGRGARAVGHKGGDINNSLKMAQKCAKVDAVLNAYGLSDLFTQDLEDLPPKNPHETPDADPNAPGATPRSERVETVKVEQLQQLMGRFKEVNPKANRQVWEEFCRETTDHTFESIFMITEWTLDRYEKVSQRIGRMERDEDA